MYSGPIKKAHSISNRSSLRDKIPARLVLYFLSWSGFLVSFMMRNDMNIALVAMITNGNETQYQNNNHSYNLNMGDATEDQISIVKSVIISSFYWCYVLSQVVGGIATQAFGTKCVFGWSQLATALCSLLMPLAAEVHYAVVIVLRSIQGFASGLTWPAMYAMVGYWIPLSERSRFMSSFQGFSIGIGLTYPLSSYAGAMANIIDLAPNYGHSGAVLAFCQTIHMSASFISPLTAGFVITKKDSIDQWRTFFEISGIIAVATYFFYQWFGAADVQSWNALRPISDSVDEETKMFPKENGKAKHIPKAK
ncbi:hypothetical protein ACLKA7_002495 [Drosophila subpalustris]